MSFTYYSILPEGQVIQNALWLLRHNLLYDDC